MVDPQSLRETATARRPRRPPPNYSSRRVQFQLLGLVFLIMAVMALMNQARKPETWQWMWGAEHATLADDPALPAPAVPDDPGTQVDTRPMPRAMAEAEADDAVVRSRAASVSLQQLLDQSRDQSLAAAQLHGWSTILEGLDRPQRELLRVGLWRYRHRQSWEDEMRRQWSALLEQLGQRWAQYQAQARTMVDENQDELTPAQQQLCRDVVTALQGRWSQQLEALRALTVLADSAALSPDHAAALQELQQALDERAWRAVEDNTVLRPVEQEAWFRTWETLETPAGRTPEQAGQPVSLVQLFSQPDAYRGRVVQIRGTARLGYYVPSTDQRFGVQGYYVLWLRGADGSNAPIVVYVRALPPGFPPLAERQPGREGTSVREEVTVSGVFFKRWLYGSQGGLNLAPLILGRISHWTPASATPPAAKLQRVNALVILYTIVAVALVALALTVWAYRSSRWSHRGLAASTQAPHELPQFEDQSVHGTVAESLREMARDQMTDKNDEMTTDEYEGSDEGRGTRDPYEGKDE